MIRTHVVQRYSGDVFSLDCPRVSRRTWTQEASSRGEAVHVSSGGQADVDSDVDEDDYNLLYDIVAGVGP